MNPTTQARIKRAIERAKRTRILDLRNLELTSIPPEAFLLEDVERLDVSNNYIRSLPDDVGSFASLRQLWIGDNPIETLPASLTKCRHLVSLDCRSTKLRDVPVGLSQLAKLVYFETSGCNGLNSEIKSASSRGCTALLEYLRNKSVRRGLKTELLALLIQRVYTEQGETDVGRVKIQQLHKHICHFFKKNSQLRFIIRNAERLLPSEPNADSAENIKEQFLALQESNQRKQMSARIELKLRALYYDEIDPTKVESMIHEVLHFVPTLDDVKFLMAHAPALFPANPQDFKGIDVYNSLLCLRQKLREDRSKAKQRLSVAISEYYGDVEPNQIEQLCTSLMKCLRFTEDVDTMASDVQELLPIEIKDAKVEKIIQQFNKRKYDEEM